MKKATVVVPNYNGKEYLHKCLKALEGQKNADFDVIIVDNGSEDGSHKVKGKYKLKLEVVRFEENRGFSAAVNEGIKRANTPFVILLNNDAYATPNFVKNLVERMDWDEGLFSAQGLMLQENRKDLVDSAGDLFCGFGWAFSRGKDKSLGPYVVPKDVFSACAGAAIYRKSVFDEIGLFDENFFAYLEDVDIGYRARLMGYRNAVVPEAMVFHVGSGSSGNRHNGFKVTLAARNSFLVMHKNFCFWQWILNGPAIGFGMLVKLIYFSKKKLGKEYREGISQYRKMKKDVQKFNKGTAANRWKIQWELFLNCFKRLL